MSAEAILALIEGLTTALPALIGLFKTATAGGTVTEAEVTAALGNYSTARAALAAAIAASTSKT
jgi:hypothetical protein